MVALTICKNFLDTLLEINAVPDISRNGLQVEGTTEINKIAFAVDASMETFQKAADADAQLLVVHHGILWDNTFRSILGVEKKRLQFLLENQLSLYAAHLPLDRHPQYGNNAQLFRLLGLQEPKSFGMSMGFPIGFKGNFQQPKPFDDVVALVTQHFGTPLQVWPFGRKEISSVALCSGSGGNELAEAVARKTELFLTGEVHHQHKSLAKEGEINVIAAGHYATETLGLKALMPLIEEKLRVSSLFLDTPTGL